MWKNWMGYLLYHLVENKLEISSYNLRSFFLPSELYFVCIILHY